VLLFRGYYSEANFEQLKQLLTHAPVLKIADPNKEFVICTNACKRGLGGVLMQDGHVVFYESQKLNEHEQNYLMHDLELATIIHALNMWSVGLSGLDPSSALVSQTNPYTVGPFSIIPRSTN